MAGDFCQCALGEIGALTYFPCTTSTNPYKALFLLLFLNQHFYLKSVTLFESVSFFYLNDELGTVVKQLFIRLVAGFPLFLILFSLDSF